MPIKTPEDVQFSQNNKNCMAIKTSCQVLVVCQKLLFYLVYRNCATNLYSGQEFMLTLCGCIYGKNLS